jgi:nucleotide-binding universal stress UspA family protein
MFSHIVVGTDGSNTAAKALSVAADLARQNDAVLHLVNAYKLPAVVGVAGLAGPAPVATDEMAPEAFVEASTKLLADAAGAAGVEKVESHSGLGSAVDVVIGVAEAVGADLIVVGSKGMTGPRRVIGSVPNSIAHRAPCHVLVVKTA